MTKELPDKIDVEIEEKDVIQSANKILNAMSSIREEYIQETKTDWKKNQDEVSEKFVKIKHDEEEYSHLSYRLASVINSLDGSERYTENIVDSIKQEPALFSYDYLQSAFWKEKSPELDKSLDKLLIMMRRENLSSMKEKHHVMQAMKYIALKDEETEKKIDLLKNILPFSSNATKNNREFFQKEIERLKLKRLKHENAVVKLDGDKNLEQVIEVASSLGFPKLQVITNTEYYKKTRKEHPSTRIIDLPLESRLDEETFEKKRRFLRKTMPWLRPLTYPILGNMPSYLKTRLEEYTGPRGFDRWTATWLSAMTNIIPYYLILETALNKIEVLPHPYDKILFLLSMGSIVGGIIETAIRLVVGISRGEGSGDPPIAGSLGKILFWPLELYMKNKSKVKDGKSIVMEIDLSGKERESLIDRNNYFQQLNQVAKKKLSKESEDNLVWSEENNHSFGVDFAYRLLECNRIKNCKTLFDAKNGAFNYYTMREFDNYVNISALACRKDERYALSLITQNKPKLEVLNKILKSKKTTEEKLKNITEKYDTDFARIIKYENCVEVYDFEAI